MRSGDLSEASEPAMAYRPFDASANGYVPGEGGAIFVVEDLEYARERGAPHMYGEIAGYGATNDAYTPMKPAPDGVQFARAISLALERAGVSPDDVDLVMADAASTPEGDALECTALRKSLGDRASQVPVTAPKSMTGRLYAGGGSIDVAAALLAMRDGCIPPTINLDQPAPGCDLNVVTQAREGRVDTVLVNGRGFGGFNSALVLRRVEGADA
jgi:minimal PKS chain-length factor (CLF/KS beta)